MTGANKQPLTVDFDTWWQHQPKNDPTKPITHRMVWEAAAKIEREECAKICDQLKNNNYCVDVRYAADNIRLRGYK